MPAPRARSCRSIARRAAAGAVFAFAATLPACSAPPAAPDVTDATAVTDVTDVTDAVTAMDSPGDHAPLPDAADVVAVDAPPFDGAIDYGTCGEPVRHCLCGCTGDTVCQQGCINGDDTCAGCVYDAAVTCCPAESAAFDRCIDRNMCVDDACIAAHCASEQSTFQTCFVRLQTSAPACESAVRACLGAGYPMVRCL